MSEQATTPAAKLRPGRCELRRMKPCRYITQLSGQTWQKCGRKAVAEYGGKLLCRKCLASSGAKG